MVLTKIDKFFNKLFHGLTMSWKNIILFAIIAGVYTGLINSLPFLSFLQNTSFTDIAVTYEWWIFFAVIIISNCKKPLDAAFKTFAFFLISQPLVYLVEVPFLEIGWGVFAYYHYWFIMTLLTFPGALIAYYGTHKDNLLSAIIMSVATCLLIVDISPMFSIDFNHLSKVHYLTMLFIIMQVVVYIRYFIKKNIFRILSIALGLIIFAIATYINLNTESVNNMMLSPIENWTSYRLVDNNKYRLELNDNILNIYFKPHAKETDLILTTKENEKATYHLSFDDNGALQYELSNSDLTLSLGNVKNIRNNIENICMSDFALYKQEKASYGTVLIDVGEEYQLILSGISDDIVENIYFKSIETNKQIDLHKDDVAAFLKDN